MALVTKRFADLRHCINGLPLQLRNIMKYNYQSQISAANSWNSYHQFRLNSLFDFDSTGAGHQPPLFDTLTPIYSRSRVKNTYLDINFHNDTTRPMRIYFLLSLTNAAPQTSALADLTNAIGYIGMLELGRADNATGHQRFRRKISIDKWAGHLDYDNKEQSASNLAALWASGSTNPATPIYLNILYECLDYSATATLGVTYTLDAKFDTIWARPENDIFEDED